MKSRGLVGVLVAVVVAIAVMVVIYVITRVVFFPVVLLVFIYPPVWRILRRKND